jgi:hypothetical protein
MPIRHRRIADWTKKSVFIKILVYLCVMQIIMALRAASSKSCKDRTLCSRLLSLSGETSIGEMCLRAVSRAAKIHICIKIEGRESPLLRGGLTWPQQTRVTRGKEKVLLPPKKIIEHSSGSNRKSLEQVAGSHQV